MFPPSLHPPAARSLEDSRKGWFFGLLVYDGSRAVKALGGQGAGHTKKTENQPDLENVPLTPRPEASRTPERVLFFVYWFMMARGPSKSWEAREPAIPINQKTRQPTQFRECSHPPSPRGPKPRGLQKGLVFWFI